MTVDEAQFSLEHQPNMPHEPPLSETEKIRTSREVGTGEKGPEFARISSRSCTIIRIYLVDPVNYGTRKSTGRRRALDWTLNRHLSRAMDNNYTLSERF